MARHCVHPPTDIPAHDPPLAAVLRCIPRFGSSLFLVLFLPNSFTSECTAVYSSIILRMILRYIMCEVNNIYEVPSSSFGFVVNVFVRCKSVQCF